MDKKWSVLSESNKFDWTTPDRGEGSLASCKTPWIVQVDPSKRKLLFWDYDTCESWVNDEMWLENDFDAVKALKPGTSYTPDGISIFVKLNK